MYLFCGITALLRPVRNLLVISFLFWFSNLLALTFDFFLFPFTPIKTFTGNSNAIGVKTNQFRDTFVTRFLRIHPKEFYRDMCLRLEFYGCSDEAGN